MPPPLLGRPPIAPHLESLVPPPPGSGSGWNFPTRPETTASARPTDPPGGDSSLPPPPCRRSCRSCCRRRCPSLIQPMDSLVAAPSNPPPPPTDTSRVGGGCSFCGHDTLRRQLLSPSLSTGGPFNHSRDQDAVLAWSSPSPSPSPSSRSCCRRRPHAVAVLARLSRPPPPALPASPPPPFVLVSMELSVPVVPTVPPLHTIAISFQTLMQINPCAL